MLGLTYDTLAQETDRSLPLTAFELRCRVCSTIKDSMTNDCSTPQPHSTEVETAHSSWFFCTGGNSFVRIERTSRYGQETSCLEANTALMLGRECRNFAQRLAHLVCMSTQYVIEPSNKAIGPYICLMPLKMAIWSYIINLPYTTTQLKWAYWVVAKLSNSGVPFSANLLTDRPYGEASASLLEHTPYTVS